MKTFVGKSNQYGFGLIELMIAVALSSLMLLGVLQIFDANKRTGKLTSSFARVQENGRIAVEMLVRDIRMADAWGCVGIGSTNILNHLETTDGNYKSYMAWANAAGVEAVDNVASGTMIDSITVKPGTDRLTVRGAKPMSNVRVTTPYMVTPAATIHINSGVDIPHGMILIITDCTGADLFTNTKNNTTSGNINHDTGNNVPANAVPNKTKDFSHTYGANAQILVPFVKTYFIGQNTAGGWSLFRQENGTTFELVRDVTDLQILYGEDTGNDHSADLFSIASSVSNMDNVVAVRASLVTESQNALGGGSPLSKTYTVTSNIRNRSL